MIKKQFVLLLLNLLLYYPLFSTIVHTFGDSHGSFFFSNDRTMIPRNEQSHFNYLNNTYLQKIEFRINWFGSKTMHSIGRDGLNALNIQNYNVTENDVALFVFGEIDARCHIGKQRDLNNRDLEEIIETLAHTFMETLQKNRSLFKNIYIVVVSVIPPTNNAYNESYPYHGSLNDRALITQKLNNKLKQLCDAYSFGFLDIYSQYTNTEGILDNNRSDGVVHINPQENDVIKKQLIDLLAQRYGLFSISQENT